MIQPEQSPTWLKQEWLGTGKDHKILGTELRGPRFVFLPQPVLWTAMLSCVSELLTFRFLLHSPSFSLPSPAKGKQALTLLNARSLYSSLFVQNSYPFSSPENLPAHSPCDSASLLCCLFWIGRNRSSGLVIRNQKAGV